MRNWRQAWRWLLIGGWGAALWGQGATTALPLGNGRGAQLYNVSIFSNYYSAGAPYGFYPSGGARPAADAQAGASASLGWDRSGQKFRTSLVYSPSYTHSVRQSDIHTMNHSLVASWRARLGRKWQMTAGAAGVVSNVEQLLFYPTQLGNLASLNASFDDLTGAVLTGRSSNFQLESVAGGLPPLSSPERTFIYGNRIFSTTFHTTFSYTPSQRTSYQWSVIGARSQYLRRTNTADGASERYVLPQTSTAGVSTGWSHSLTPRTQIGVTAMTSRMFSRIQQAYTGSAIATLGRTMSRRWFMQANLGAGLLTHLRQSSSGPRGVRYIAGGGIGYKTFAHTWLTSWSRTIGDPYGLGAGSTVVGTGAWSWQRPGRPWASSATIGYQRLQGNAVAQAASWSATLTLARQMGEHLSLSAQYGYYHLPRFAAVTATTLSTSGVVVALTWIPSGPRRSGQENSVAP